MKIMKKTCLFILKLLLICTFLFTSCEKDEILTEPSMSNQNQVSKIFQNSFDSKQFTKTLPYKYNVDWSNPVKQYSEELETYFYEFPIIYSDSYNPDVFNEQIKRDFYQKYKVVVTENEEGEFDFFIAKYFLKNIDGNTEVENSKLSLNTNKGYKGTLHLYDKEATITFAKHINNDKENKSFYSKNGKLNSAQAKWVDVCKTITTYHYKDWFWVVYDGYGRIISSTFLYTTFEGTSQKQECLQQWMPDPIIPKTPCTAFECNGVYYEFKPEIACQIGYKNDGLGNCVKLPTLIADDQLIGQVIEENIDDSQLDPCLKGIMEQLKTTKTADIANVLAKLGANSIYTVNMLMKPAGTYAETQRIPKSKYNYEIRVDRDRYTDGTKLFKATALIHELIQAYFLSIVDDYNNTPSTALPSFSELFEVYVKKEHPTSTEKTDAQHLAMANKYVDAMASALMEYDANYIIDYQVYKDLAWGGLIDAPIFNATFPPGSAENIRIINRYKAESSGHAVEQGTPNVQIPVGKPCN